MANLIEFLIACLLVGAESRTIDSSNLIDAIVKASGKIQASRDESGLFSSKDINDSSNFVNSNRDSGERNSRFGPEDLTQYFGNEGLDLEKLMADFASKTADMKDYEDSAVQWLRQLKLMLELMSTDAPNEKSKRIDGILNEIGDMGKSSLTGSRKMLPIGEKNWLDDLLNYLDERDIEAQSSEDNESHVKSRYESSSTSFSLTDENIEDDGSKSDGNSAEELDNMLAGVQNEIGMIRRYFEKLCSKHHSMLSLDAHSDDHNHDRSTNVVQAKKVLKF